METDETRSHEVIQGYKRHKLAASALRRIHELLHDFERERLADRKLALVGMTVVLLVLVFLGFGFFSTRSIILP